MMCAAMDALSGQVTPTRGTVPKAERFLCVLKPVVRAQTMFLGAGLCRIGLFCLLCLGAVTASLHAQVLATPPALTDQAPVHYQHEGIMSPGQIAAARLQRGGPIAGYFQPIEIKAPFGVSVALAEGSQFGPLQPTPIRVGLLIGPVYRLRLTHIPRHAGEELYPTIEVIDRLYTPVGQEARFAIPIQFHQEDLELALAGKLVTRVIYVEDPQRALPISAEAGGENWFEAGSGRDPLAVADQLGRPVAILRIGGRVPMDPEQPEPEFMGPGVPYEKYPPRMKILQPPRREPSSPKEAAP